MVQPSLSLNLVTDGEKVTKSATKSTETMNEVLAFCERPKSLTEIMAHLGLKHRNNAKSRYIDPLIENGFLEMTIPEKPNSRNQKYARALSLSVILVVKKWLSRLFVIAITEILFSKAVLFICDLFDTPS